MFSTRMAHASARPIGNRHPLRRVLTFVIVVTEIVASIQPAMAALPQPVQPGNGVAAGDYIALLQQYWKEGIAFLVLAIGAYGFVEVGGGAVAKFREWREGKAELSDLKWFFVIGVVMLVALVYLLTIASGIL